MPALSDLWSCCIGNRDNRVVHTLLSGIVVYTFVIVQTHLFFSGEDYGYTRLTGRGLNFSLLGHLYGWGKLIMLVGHYSYTTNKTCT